jgi:hypothetical protein
MRTLCRSEGHTATGAEQVRPSTDRFVAATHRTRKRLTALEDRRGGRWGSADIWRHVDTATVTVVVRHDGAVGDRLPPYAHGFWSSRRGWLHRPSTPFLALRLDQHPGCPAGARLKRGLHGSSGGRLRGQGPPARTLALGRPSPVLKLILREIRAPGARYSSRRTRPVAELELLCRPPLHLRHGVDIT